MTKPEPVINHIMLPLVNILPAPLGHQAPYSVHHRAALIPMTTLITLPPPIMNEETEANAFLQSHNQKEALFLASPSFPLFLSMYHPLVRQIWTAFCLQASQARTPENRSSSWDADNGKCRNSPSEKSQPSCHARLALDPEHSMLLWARGREIIFLFIRKLTYEDSFHSTSCFWNSAMWCSK